MAARRDGFLPDSGINKRGLHKLWSAIRPQVSSICHEGHIGMCPSETLSEHISKIFTATDVCISVASLG